MICVIIQPNKKEIIRKKESGINFGKNSFDY